MKRDKLQPRPPTPSSQKIPPQPLAPPKHNKAQQSTQFPPQNIIKDDEINVVNVK
jgi:hypothetical protein